MKLVAVYFSSLSCSFSGYGGKWAENTFIYHGATALVVLLIIEDSRSQSDTPHFVGLLWTGDQLVTETST